MVLPKVKSQSSGQELKVDCPKEFLGRKVYLVITRDNE